MSSASAQMARQRWELENGVEAVSGAGPGGAGTGSQSTQRGGSAGARGTAGGRGKKKAHASSGSSGAGTSSSASDALFVYNAVEQANVQRQAAWTTDPEYFTSVKVSALALLKMAIHCRSGGDIEVMGMLQGKTIGRTFVVIDAFALPVEGTETRVNAQAEAYEYMVAFSGTNKEVGRLENVVGWYHSHPGYGCWMSGIDCSTQMLNQQYQEPFLAIVIDPHRTAAAGKVELGAFRTFPEGYERPASGTTTGTAGASTGSGSGGAHAQRNDSYQPIPLSKMEDFGAYSQRYYQLEVSYFKSSLDANLMDVLWNTYWVDTLSNTPMLSGNARDFVSGQIRDLADKIEQVQGSVASHSGRGMSLLVPDGASSHKMSRDKLVDFGGGRGSVGGVGSGGSSGGRPGTDDKHEASPLAKVARDNTMLAAESIKAQAAQVVKDLLFNFRRAHSVPGAVPAADDSVVVNEVEMLEAEAEAE